MAIQLEEITHIYHAQGNTGSACNPEECPFRPFLANTVYGDSEKLGAFPGAKMPLNGAQIIACCGEGILAAIRSCSGNTMGLLNHRALNGTEGFTGITEEPTGKALLKLTGLKLGLNAYFDFYYDHSPQIPVNSLKLPGIPMLTPELLNALGNNPGDFSEEIIRKALEEVINTAYEGSPLPSEKYSQMGTALVALIDPALVKINALRSKK